MNRYFIEKGTDRPVHARRERLTVDCTKASILSELQMIRGKAYNGRSGRHAGGKTEQGHNSIPSPVVAAASCDLHIFRQNVPLKTL